jgi:hypothetical protein
MANIVKLGEIDEQVKNMYRPIAVLDGIVNEEIFEKTNQNILWIKSNKKLYKIVQG